MSNAEAAFHRPLHALAILVAAATFPLIFMGGLVTTHGAGMAVPDWPNTYGYNMFTFPPSQWVGGIWYEHVHRLWGSLVGFLSILLCLNAWGPAAGPRWRRRLVAAGWALAALSIATVAIVYALRAVEAISYEQRKTLDHLVVGIVSLALIIGAAAVSRRREPRRWVRWLCTIVLVAVCVQGIKGGLRVTEVNIVLAMVHGCFAHLFFCLAAFAAVATSRWWLRAPDLSSCAGAPTGRRIALLGGACMLAIFLQLIAGATMRHNDAGLAIPDLPWAFGKLLPPTSAEELSVANRLRTRYASDAEVTDSRILRQMAAPVTLTQVWLHFAHRVGALVVSGMLIGLLTVASRRGQALVFWAACVAGLLVVQFTLGVLTVWWKKPADIASLHVATGALLLMSTSVLTIRALRLYSTRFRGSVSRATAPLNRSEPSTGRAAGSLAANIG